jgi:arylsulfatase A-like enzyme
MLPPGRLAFAAFAALAVCLGLGLIGCSAAPPRPHVVIFLADDLGWADVGFRGSAIPTPHIDRLAATGTVLGQFYVESICVPTRAALLTGRYPMRYGLHETGRELPLAERTLAEALREVGYRTAIVGKWDLGFDAVAQRPTARGFDHQYGHYHSSIDSHTQRYLGGLDWHRDDQPLREAGYSTTLMGDEALRLIEAHDAAEPLFLLLAFNAPHAPLAAPKHCLDRMPPRTGDSVWGQRVYGGMVACLDDQVGRIVAALEERGMRDQTLILFVSDNGGDPKAGAQNGEFKGTKLSLYEAGVRAVAVANWPGVIPAGAHVNELMHVTDLYPTLIGLAGGSSDQRFPVDGRDQWPAMAYGKSSARTELPIGVGQKRGALRRGRWKLITYFDAQARPVNVRLYDLSEDPFEQYNLARSEASVLRDMLTRLLAYRADAVPALPGPNYRHREIPAVWGHDEAMVAPDAAPKSEVRSKTGRSR